MSKFNSSQSNTGIGALLKGIGAAIDTNATGSHNEKSARIVAGLESADFEVASHRNVHVNIEQQLRGIYGATRDLKDGGITEAGLEAAAILVAANRAPEIYANASRQLATPSGARVFGPLGNGAAGSLSYSIGNEAFDTQELRKHTVQSIAYTLDAVRQDALGELFFPTIVGTPDQAFYKVTITRPTIFRGIEHTRDGVPVKFEKFNLLDSYRDAKLLENNATSLVPHATTESAAFLAPALKVATVEVEVNGVAVPTRPLLLGKKIGIVGISQHPTLVANGMCNQTDHIDRGARIKKVYVEVRKEGAPSELIAFDTSHMPTNNFYKTMEGKGTDGMAKLTARSLRIHAGTKAVDGTDVDLLADFVAADLAVDLEATFDGEINFEQGWASLRGTELTVRTIHKDKDTLASHASLAGITFVPVYWEIDARLTNSNRRTRGTLLDNDVWEEIYTIGLLAPISVQKPVATSEEAAKEIETDTLVKATHVMISNSAVTTLLNYCEHLKAFYSKHQNNLRAASIDAEGIEGIGRMLVTPLYLEGEIDIMEVVNVLTSTNKLQDLRGFFTTFLTEIGYRMAQTTGYLPALRQYTNNPDAVPKMLIGTDIRLPQFIMLPGDSRPVGPKMDMEIASSPDSRMENQIVISFGGVSKDEFCPLNSGNMIWIPEWLSTIPVQRTGEVVNETACQPRFRHLVNLPIFARFTVSNLDKYASENISLKFQNVP